MATAPEPATPRHKMGRPTKLTPGTATEVVKRVEAGASVTAAARAAGVHRATVFRWQAAGRGSDAETLARELAESLARAYTERSRKFSTCEPITDEQGREIGVRTGRRLHNGIIEVTERYTSPGHRAIRRCLREGRRDELAAVLRLDGAA